MKGIMQERYRIKVRNECPGQSSKVELGIPTDTWRYGIIDYRGPFAFGSIIALALDKAMAEHITQLLNKGELSCDIKFEIGRNP